MVVQVVERSWAVLARAKEVSKKGGCGLIVAHLVDPERHVGGLIEILTGAVL